MKISRIRWTVLLVLFAGPVVAFYFYAYIEERALRALPDGFRKFSLSDPLPPCARWQEHMPSPRDPAAYRIYIEARRVWRSKIGWELTRHETTRILADVSKAADLGDWGARALMAHFYLYGLGSLKSNHVLDSAPEKALEIQRMAAQAGQPWALYDIGTAHEHGYGGALQDEDLAWAYYLRAAELGSPEAQMALASAYGEAGRLEDERTMQRCAYLQGHGPAAYALGMDARVNNRIEDAVNFFHKGTKSGSSECAATLSLLFNEGHWPNDREEEKEALVEIGIRADTERSRRYRAISDALKINPDLKLTRLDSVLPLPPAPLPEWSGIGDAIELETNGSPKY